MNNEPNKPIPAQELTEKELEGIAGGGSTAIKLVRELEVRRLQQDPLQQELQKALKQEAIVTVSSE